MVCITDSVSESYLYGIHLVVSEETLTTAMRQFRQQQQQPFYGPLSGTIWVSWYQKKHSPPTILIITQSLSASSIYHDP